MSHPKDIAVRITMTVLQSIETAVRREILWYRVNRDTSGGIKLCHSQEMAVRIDITVLQSIEIAVRIV